MNSTQEDCKPQKIPVLETKQKITLAFTQREGEANKLLTQQIIWIIFLPFFCHFASVYQVKKGQNNSYLLFPSEFAFSFASLDSRFDKIN